MRGDASKQVPMYFVINVEAELPSSRPLRAIKRRADAILRAMNRNFEAACSKIGRPGIAPERLLKALLLQPLYSIRSEIQLMQAIQFNLLHGWFMDLSDGPVWTPETFSMNRKRFEEHDPVRKFFDRIVSEAVIEGYASKRGFV
jgi:transposase